MAMDIILNGAARTVAAPTIADLLIELDLAQARVAVERNGDLVPRARHAQTPVCAGDRIEVVTLVGGG